LGYSCHLSTLFKTFLRWQQCFKSISLPVSDKHVTIQYDTLQYNTIQYNTIQYNTIQYNTIQYNTIQYNIIQYIDEKKPNYYKHKVEWNKICTEIFNLPAGTSTNFAIESTIWGNHIFKFM
jgi:hypothetical protein